MRPGLGAIRGRPAYGFLGIIVVVVLALGSHHQAAPTSTERIAHLESIIKCPSCSVDTIAQSDSTVSVGLQQTVRQMVDAGDTDAEVEAYVVKKFGSDEILAPHGVSGEVAVGIPLAAFAVATVAIAVTLVRRGRWATGSAPAEVGDADLAIVAAALADRRGER